MYFDEAQVLLDYEAASPEAAIRTAGDLLVGSDLATPGYVDAMVEAYRTIGSYIVLAPHVAMPHARPEFGGLGPGIAIVRLIHPIAFGHPDNDPVRVVIPLVGNDGGAHIQMLQRIAVVLRDPVAMTTILSSQDKTEVVALFR